MKTKQTPNLAVFPRLSLLALTALLTSVSDSIGADVAAPARPEEPVQLSALEVSTDRARDENYKADRSRIGTRTDTALQDVPQSITVVTAGQILDQQMTSIGDVVRYVPGVSAHQGENNRDQIIFRGNSSSADFFLNGVRDDVQYYRDLYNLDRVEVLRGPNAMVFGRGGGGGVINRATKEADFSPLREITLQGGSFDFRRASLDFNQPLNRHAAIRLNAVVEDSGSFRHSVERQRQGFNPTLTLMPEKPTKLTLSYEYFRDTRVADRGITSFQGRPVDVPAETYFGHPANAPVRATVHLATAALEHRTENLIVRNRTMRGDYDRFYQNFVPGAVTPDKSLVALTAYNNATRRKNLFSQTDLTYAVATGSLRHTLLGGFELGRQVTDNFRRTGYFNNASTSISVPLASPAISTPVTWRQSATDANNHLRTALAAIYAQDQVEFTRHWQAIVGVRFDSFDLTYHDNRTGNTLGRRDQLVSPRTGLIFKPSAKVSIYGNYAVSFLPSSGDQFSSLTTITQQVKPEKFANYEIGTKWDLPDNFALTTAIYQLDRTNTRATDPADPTRIVQTGSQRTRGFEFGLGGSLTKAWTASIGYAWQDAHVISATTAARAGAAVAQVPRHSFSFWNKYQLSKRLSAGLGLVHRTQVFATIDNTVTLPGYTEVDAAVYYSLGDRWRVQINVENLFDKKYYLDADTNTNISPGSPRAIRLGLTTRF
ncbi:MAG: TonB-dependent siderophore receptor [Opitutaceae bacterium]